MKKREYKWFIEPLDAKTNQVLAEELPESNAGRHIICADGKPHNLWGCSSGFLSSFIRNKRPLDLKFKAYARAGEGKIRECNRWYQHKKRRRNKTAV
jgi:hypothetical protein